jgi:hypothetical protein
LGYKDEDLAYEGQLVKNKWGMVQDINLDYISFTGDEDKATYQVDTSDESITDGYDIDNIARSLGLSSNITGVSEYINNVRPNNSDQFRRQLPVLEEKNGFERISDYTLDGCYFQVHDAKDNAYNIWYTLDDADGVTPAPPATSGILVIVNTIPPGAPASTVAYETMLALSASHSDKFELAYEDGDEFFSVTNTEDGSTKDADSTIMGLPTTTGFYLTDEGGDEYDNEDYYWSWTGGIGFFSFAITTTDTETYATGKTPEEAEHFWHGDPIQEGVDPYHVNTNSCIDSYWLGSYPFESRYATLKRGKWRRDSKDWNVTTWNDEEGTFEETSRSENAFISVLVTGSNMPYAINDPTLEVADPATGDIIETSYPVLTIIGDGSPQPLGTNLRWSVKTNENFLKFYFGSGDTWQKNPELEFVTLYSDGYDWPSVIPRIRGWKYGLKSALPENSSAVYKHDAYGQFRDMLEQRKDTRFYRILTRGRFLGRSVPSAAPVRVLFVDEDGSLTPPDKTWSQNLSRFCTSSLPYFDDGVPRNREHPIDEADLNTSYGTIED